MRVILAVLVGAAGAIFWAMRARNAVGAARELADMAGDVMSAARRFGFRRRYNEHPVDSLKDPDVAIAGLGIAFMEMDGLPTVEQQDALMRSMQHRLGHDLGKAEEALVLGRWLVNECGGADPGFTRLAKRLVRLGGTSAFDPATEVLRDVAAAGRGGQINDCQREAMEDLVRQFRPR